MTTVKSELAFGINSEIVACKMNIEANFIHLAQLLKRVRDEKLYLSLDQKTFESYLGDPDIAIGRSTAYKLIASWELYVERLSVPEPTLLDIGSKRLGYISPVVSDDVDGWLSKAKSLSLSDLLQEVRSCQGKPPLSSLKVPAGQISRTGQTSQGIADLLSKYPTYLDYVRDQPCMVCSAPPPSDAHHFPQGRVRTDNREKTVPLCRGCHQEYHQSPLKFLNDYKSSWGDYFFSFIFRIWEKA